MIFCMEPVMTKKGPNLKAGTTAGTARERYLSLYRQQDHDYFPFVFRSFRNLGCCETAAPDEIPSRSPSVLATFSKSQMPLRFNLENFIYDIPVEYVRHKARSDTLDFMRPFRSSG